jgi:hypothetical protein
MYLRQDRRLVILITAIFLASFAVPTLRAQTVGSAAPSEGVGPTASELVSGSSSSVGGMLSFDTSVGMNFTKNFGADIGVPYFLVTRPGIFASTQGRTGYVSQPFVACSFFFFGCFTGVSTSSRMWGGELGNFYADLHYARPYHQYNFATVLTGEAPTASFRKGLTTGRVQWDWFNHIDTDFRGFSPFVNFGLANGRMNQHFLPRPFNTGLPFRTFGYMADFEGGVQYKVWRRFNLGASMWDVLPMGPQKIYSELVWQGPVNTSGMVNSVPPKAIPAGALGSLGYVAGDPNHARYWNTAFETSGFSKIARDNGYSASLGVSPHKFVDFQVGYSHSVRYNLDWVTFTVGLNANSLVRKLTNY